jgi:hypothetical protein
VRRFLNLSGMLATDAIDLVALNAQENVPKRISG